MPIDLGVILVLRNAYAGYAVIKGRDVNSRPKRPLSTQLKSFGHYATGLREKVRRGRMGGNVYRFGPNPHFGENKRTDEYFDYQFPASLIDRKPALHRYAAEVLETASRN